MPLLLALDASLARCSAALVTEAGEVVREAVLDIAQGQPARLPELAAEALGGARPDAVAVVVGPGSFTGIRTALALGRGIALASGIPCLGVTTGEALAAALPGEARVWAVLDNRRGGLFLERLEGCVPLAAPVALRWEELPVPEAGVCLTGDAAEEAARRLEGAALAALTHPAPAAWPVAGSGDPAATHPAPGQVVRLSGLRLPQARDAARAALGRQRAGMPPRDARPLYVEPPAVR